MLNTLSYSTSFILLKSSLLKSMSARLNFSASACVGDVLESPALIAQEALTAQVGA